MSAAEIEANFVSKLLARAEVAENTMAFQFEKPGNWTFRPGQFIEVSLVDPPETDSEGDSRPLSIAGAPEEPNIMVATRMRASAFKRVLRSLPIGTPVRIEGPFGNFVLHNNAARPAVFISGGIGITPVRSIVFHAARQKLPHRIFLFYANRRPQDAPFLEEITALAAENPRFTCVPIMTSTASADQPWKGETGHITGDLLRKYVAEPQEAVYYLCGPGAMVASLQNALHETGIDDDNIRTEEFPGY